MTMSTREPRHSCRTTHGTPQKTSKLRKGREAWVLGAVECHGFWHVSLERRSESVCAEGQFRAADGARELLEGGPLVCAFEGPADEKNRRGFQAGQVGKPGDGGELVLLFGSAGARDDHRWNV